MCGMFPSSMEEFSYNICTWNRKLKIFPIFVHGNFKNNCSELRTLLVAVQSPMD